MYGLLLFAGDPVIYSKEMYESRASQDNNHGYPPIRKHEDELVGHDFQALPNLHFNWKTGGFDFIPKTAPEY